MSNGAVQQVIAGESFAARLAQAADDTERLLTGLLSDSVSDGETLRPSRLIEAMRYAALGGGKRLRPFLTIESAALFGVPRERALMAGAAIECVHCYSLVHDDLPAMDDDQMRRGRPTAHMAYDEATAILTGDSLLTFAFDILAKSGTHPDPAVRIALVAGLAAASGVGGMAGGQMLDLAAEGRFGPAAAQSDQASTLTMQSMKTGALIRFCCVAGGLLGGAKPTEIEALAHYGDAIGQAFQIADDLLDLEGDSTVVGKATGKDAARGKATIINLLGRDGARSQLEMLRNKAQHSLAPFGETAATLLAAARFVADRNA